MNVKYSSSKTIWKPKKVADCCEPILSHSESPLSFQAAPRTAKTSRKNRMVNQHFSQRSLFPRMRSTTVIELERMCSIRLKSGFYGSDFDSVQSFGRLITADRKCAVSGRKRKIFKLSTKCRIDQLIRDQHMSVSCSLRCCQSEISTIDIDFLQNMSICHFLRCKQTLKSTCQ